VDRKLIGWDIRTESGKVWELKGVHGDDINCVEWNHYDSNLIASGASDGTI
jgi:WD40 repeat protein